MCILAWNECSGAICKKVGNFPAAVRLKLSSIEVTFSPDTHSSQLLPNTQFTLMNDKKLIYRSRNSEPIETRVRKFHIVLLILKWITLHVNH